MPRNHLLTSIWHSPRITNLRHAASPARLLRHATARRRRLPDYIIAGAQKAGTTSLFAYLSEHPQVEPPIAKEIRYFDRFHDRGLNWYRMHFPLGNANRRGADVATLTGEATPNYMFYGPTAGRIARALGGVKVILLVRNPVDRAFSHYQLRVKRRQEARTFDLAVEEEIERLERDREPIAADADYYLRIPDRFTYLARGLYLDQIRRWQRHFGREQLLILESGRLFKHTAEVFAEVCDFLALDRARPAEFGNRYPGRYQETMSGATRRRLIDYFAAHNARLYAHLGTRFDWDR